MFDPRSIRFSGVLLISTSLAACGSSGSPTPSTAPSNFTLTTPEITVSAGEERYVCFSKTLDEEVSVDRFDFEGESVVHHVFLSRSIVPEPEGLSECNVIFKQTWLPMFVTGSGTASLEYPSGAATKLRKGAQIVLQLHLLNASTIDAHRSVSVVMRRSPLSNPDPVGIYAFGTQKIALPPKAASQVVDECKPSEDVEAFATLAHLHRLGTSLHFSVEGDDGAMQEVVNRDPYLFDAQFIEAKPIVARKGKNTKVTCSYDNTTDRTVGFGESSNDEMCYLVGYVRGKEGAFGCTPPPVQGDGGMPTACMPRANAAGVGAPCTQGGNECKEGLTCSLDQAPSSDGAPGFCLRVGGCTTSADCGGGDATCCAPAEAGGAINICIPESCRPATCAVK